MKRWLLCLILACLPTIFVAAPAMAQHGNAPGNFGIGIGAGTITRLGLSAKHFLGSGSAIQANLGCGGWSCSGIGLSADYLFEMPALAQGEALALAWNAGLGPGVGLHSDVFALAGAGIVGLELDFKVIPIDLVVEWRPTLLIVPDVHFKPVEFSGHVRVWF